MIQPTDVIIGVKLEDSTDVATNMMYQLREWLTKLSTNFIISNTHTKVTLICMIFFYLHKNIKINYLKIFNTLTLTKSYVCYKFYWFIYKKNSGTIKEN